jgi:cytochrome b6-f complex iron-sulfur subunit
MMSVYRITRRKFFSTVGQGALAAAIVSPLAGINAFAGQKTMAPVTLDLTKPDYEALTKTGGVLKIPNPLDKKKPVIVIRVSETEVAAFSSKCTHLGCEISLPVNGVMICPCHSARFDTTGAAIKGPAKKALKKFEAVMQGNTITINAPQDKK